MTWRDIHNQRRHALGFEKIDKNQIQAEIPSFITEDAHNLLVFRFSGKKPMVGYRVRNVLYVLWFDKNYSLYPH